MSKIKTYVLMLSEFFPKQHRKAGMPTGFKVKFSLGQGCPDCGKKAADDYRPLATKYLEGMQV